MLVAHRRGAAVRSREENRALGRNAGRDRAAHGAPEGDVGGAVGHECVGAGRDVPRQARSEILGLRSRCAAARGDAHLVATGTQTCRPRHSAKRPQRRRRLPGRTPPQRAATMAPRITAPSGTRRRKSATTSSSTAPRPATTEVTSTLPLAPEARAELAVHRIEVRRGRLPRRSGPPSPVRRGGASAVRRHGDDLLEAARKRHFDRGVARTEGDRRDRHLRCAARAGIERGDSARRLRLVGEQQDRSGSRRRGRFPRRRRPRRHERQRASDRVADRGPCRDAAARPQPRGVAIGGGRTRPRPWSRRRRSRRGSGRARCRGMSPPTCAAAAIRLGWTSLAAIEREVSMASTTVASSLGTERTTCGRASPTARRSVPRGRAAAGRSAAARLGRDEPGKRAGCRNGLPPRVGGDRARGRPTRR